MQRHILLAVALLLAPGAWCSSAAAAAAQAARVVENLDFDWRFFRGDAPDAPAPDFDDGKWRVLDLPHDWSIEGEYREDSPDRGAGAYLPGGVGWYRRGIDVPEWWRGKHVRIEFDAAQRNSDVWINGQHLGHRPYGYISFSYDLAPHLKFGQRNVVVVRLDNPLPAARWYTGSGIYAHVRLVVADKLRVAQWGTFVTTTSVSDERADVSVATEIVNERGDAADARLVSEVRDENGHVLAKDEKSLSLAAGEKQMVAQTVHVDRPQLWSPDLPRLYRLVQRLYRGNEQADEVTTPFGIRTIRFDANTGFWINGRNEKLKGVGIHYDASPAGVAIPDEVLEDRLRRLKEMGCNAIRTGHTPFPPKFYELCDRLGLMVMDEIFDGWRKKVEHDYGATAFKEWWRRDLTDWVRRDRNHPSVILWSLGNETGHSDRLGMSAIVRELDPTRLTTGGQMLEGVGVAGFNGPGEVPGVLEKFHAEHPDLPIVLTEQTHAYQTRGFYRAVTNYRETDPKRNTPFEPYATMEIFDDGEGDPQHRSSYDNAPVRITSRQCWRRTRDTQWISGEFRWAGFDYLGEAHWGGRKWPARHWHPGIHDTSGLPKDTAYFYQSQWSIEPMVHVLPHWTHPLIPRGTQIPVVAYSNADEVELFLDGRSLGRKKPRAELLDFVWNVPYEPGELRAVAYRGGREVASKRFRTAGAPEKIKLDRHGPELAADRRDVSTVTFGITDARGELVPWAMARVEFRAEGPVHVIGYENGNNTDVTPNHAPYRNAFHGLGRGFFQATAEGGPVELVAAAILGDRSLRRTQAVALAVERIPLRGPLPPAALAIHYTTDGAKPTPSSPRYRQPFKLAGDATVRMLVTRDGQPYVSSTTQFKKLEPKLSATTVTETKQPTQPRDGEIVGVWREGDRIYRFDPEGRVFRKRGREGAETEVARWWYDYPDDVFEDESAVGGGEIRWNDSGAVAVLQLAPGKRDQLLINPDAKPRRLRRERE